MSSFRFGTIATAAAAAAAVTAAKRSPAVTKITNRTGCQ